LPMDVITKQLDCWTARRSRGSMLVTWVALPNWPYQSALRPSSMAMVPRVLSQRSRFGLAPTLVLPPAEPDMAVDWLPVLIRPPPAQAVRAALSRHRPNSLVALCE